MYYVKDPTIMKIVEKETVAELVDYLDALCHKLSEKTRTQFMNEMVELNHGYDDDAGTYFTELMASELEIGVVGVNGRLKPTNIHEHQRNLKRRTETGD
jgi:hypothetical protein